MNVWAVTYEFSGRDRTIIIETSDNSVAEVQQHLHPAISSKVLTVEFVGVLA